MIRIGILCEGPTEVRFVNTVLSPHLLARHTHVWASSLNGIKSWGNIRRQLMAMAGEDPSAWVTTMLDYYGLPADFPERSIETGDVPTRVGRIEGAMRDGCQDARGTRRIHPYLSVHEFEALLFASPAAFAQLAKATPEAVAALTTMTEHCAPEAINDGVDTAPSKRIERHIPGFKKTVDGLQVAQTITLAGLRDRCPHFHAWVSWMETLG